MAPSCSLLASPLLAPIGVANRERPHRRCARRRSICNASLESGEPASLSLALVSGGVIAALAATLSLADPEQRRQQQAASVLGGGDDEKLVVRDYFNTTGFERWKRIYGEAEDVNSVQLDIREGHAQTVEKTLAILESSSLKGITFCDAGCGTGSLAIPVALRGATVFASDISSSMVAEAETRAKLALKSDPSLTLPKFTAQDLESLAGKYHTVACLDVLIHYPQEKADGMIRHLASLAEKRLIISFAPKTWYYSLLKRVGELFPGPSKATRAYLHAEEDVEAALKSAGWMVRSREMTATRFYFSRLLEAVPVSFWWDREIQENHYSRDVDTQVTRSQPSLNLRTSVLSTYGTPCPSQISSPCT